MKALVICPNERTSDLGCLLAIARSEACRREQVKVNPPVRALVYVAELGVYVAIYEVLGDGRLVSRNSVIGKISNEKVNNTKSERNNR